jgi:hypothetical protein
MNQRIGQHMNSQQKSGHRAAPPVGLDAWRSCKAELDQRLQDNGAARDQVSRQRQHMLLAAARGNPDVQRQLQQLTERDGRLLMAATLTGEALALATREIAAAEAEGLGAARAEALAALDRQLRQRLVLVAEVERAIDALRLALEQLGAAGAEITERHHAIGGQRRFLPPLGQEAAGGRLAEYISGLGLDCWLPLPRPEARPPISSLVAAEAAAQESYRLPA